MANNDVRARMLAHTREVKAVPQRNGDIIDGISREERAEIRRVLASGGNSIPAEKRGVCLEEDGRHLDAGIAFRDAARKLQRKDKTWCAALAERATRNFILAGDVNEAVAACRMAILAASWNDNLELLKRTVGFCIDEAGKVEGTDRALAVRRLKVALELSSPVDFEGAVALTEKIRSLGGRGDVE